jgi:hypothetical protein
VHPDLINACIASLLLYACVLVVFVAVFRRYFPEMRLGLIALLLLIAALLLMAYSLASMYPFPLRFALVYCDAMGAVV